MRSRVFDFVWSIISIPIIGVLTYLCWSMNNNLADNGLGNIVVIPIVAIIYFLLFGVLLSSCISIIKAIFSDIKAIKIISIILVVILSGLLILDILVFMKFINVV